MLQALPACPVRPALRSSIPPNSPWRWRISTRSPSRWPKLRKRSSIQHGRRHGDRPRPSAALHCRPTCRGSSRCSSPTARLARAVTKRMHPIGEDLSERLDVIPAQYRVLVTRRPKYACRACEGAGRTSPGAGAADRGGPADGSYGGPRSWSTSTPTTCRFIVNGRSWPARASISIMLQPRPVGGPRRVPAGAGGPSNAGAAEGLGQAVLR